MPKVTVFDILNHSLLGYLKVILPKNYAAEVVCNLINKTNNIDFINKLSSFL